MYRHTHWLISVQNGDLLEESPPAWVTWESNDNYLPAAFYDTKSTFSLSELSAFARGVGNDPITADGDTLASYDQVELVALLWTRLQSSLGHAVSRDILQRPPI